MENHDTSNNEPQTQKKDYGYTTISLKPDFRRLLEEYADFHDMKQAALIHSIIVLFGMMKPETREAMLALAEHIISWYESGHPLIFNEELDIPATLAEEFYNDTDK